MEVEHLAYTICAEKGVTHKLQTLTNVLAVSWACIHPIFHKVDTLHKSNQLYQFQLGTKLWVHISKCEVESLKGLIFIPVMM